MVEYVRIPHSTRLILASGSPRRREILSRMGLTYVAITPGVDESAILTDSHLPEHAIPGVNTRSTTAIHRPPDVESALFELSHRKASWVSTRLSLDGRRQPVWIIGADTVILKGARIFGKPKDIDHATAILKELSGCDHHVVTTISIIRAPDGATLSEIEYSTVKFIELSQDQITAYLATEQWRNAAGGYRIQESGELLIESISGCYSNVVGLPIRRIYGMLLQLEYPLGGNPAKFPVS